MKQILFFDSSESPKVREIEIERMNNALTRILGDDIDIMSVEEREAFRKNGYSIFGKLQKGKISLFSKKGKVKYTTPRHEVFHWIFNHVISDAKRESIIVAAKDLMLEESKYKERLASEISDKEVDEWLAAKYAKLYSGKEFKGVKGLVFKFFNFTRQTIFRLRKQGNFLSQTFDKIENGNYSSSGMIYNRLDDNTRYDEQNYKEVLDEVKTAIIDKKENLKFDIKRQFGGYGQFSRFTKGLLISLTYRSVLNGKDLSVEDAISNWMINTRQKFKALVFDKNGDLKEDYKYFDTVTNINYNDFIPSERQKYANYIIAHDELIAPIMEFVIKGFNFKEASTTIASNDSINTVKSRTKAFDDSSSVMMQLFLNTIKYYHVNEDDVDNVKWVKGQFVDPNRARVLMLKAAENLRSKKSAELLLGDDNDNLALDFNLELGNLANMSTTACEDRNILLSIQKALRTLNIGIDINLFDNNSSISDKQNMLAKMSLRNSIISQYVNSFRRNSMNVEMTDFGLKQTDSFKNLSEQIKYNIKDTINNTLFSEGFISDYAKDKLGRYNIMTNESDVLLDIKINNQSVNILKGVKNGKNVDYSFVNPATNVEMILEAFQFLGITKEVPKQLLRDILTSTEENNKFKHYEDIFLDDALLPSYLGSIGYADGTLIQEALANMIIGSMLSLKANVILKDRFGVKDISIEQAAKPVKKTKAYKLLLGTLENLKSGSDFNMYNQLGIEGDFQFPTPGDFWKAHEILGDLTMHSKGTRGEVFNYDQLGNRFMRNNRDHQLSSRFNYGVYDSLQDIFKDSNNQMLNFFGNSNNRMELMSIESVKANNKATNTPELYDYAKTFIETFEASLKKSGKEGKQIIIPVLNLADRLDMSAIKFTDRPMDKAANHFKNRAEYYYNQHKETLGVWKEVIEENGLSVPNSRFFDTSLKSNYSEEKNTLFEAFVKKNTDKLGKQKFMDLVRGSELVYNLDYSIDKKTNTIIASRDFCFKHKNFGAIEYSKLNKLDYSNPSLALQQIGAMYEDVITKEVHTINKLTGYHWDSKFMEDSWDEETISKEWNSGKEINPTYLRWFYYNVVVGGDFNDMAFGHAGIFLDSNERSKRAKTRTTPNTKPSCWNKYTLGQRFKIIPLSSKIKDEVMVNGKLETIDADDGGAKMTILAYAMLKNSFGGKNAPFEDGVIKPIYNGVDIKRNRPLGLKFAMVPTTKGLFNMSASIRRIEMNALDAWTNNVIKEGIEVEVPFDAKEMFLRHYKQNNENIDNTVITMMDELFKTYGSEFEDIKDQMVGMIVPPGALKYGSRSLNNVDIREIQKGVLGTISLNTTDLGIITNLTASPDDYKERLVPMNQPTSIIGALSPEKQSQISKINSKIFDLGIKKYQKELSSIPTKGIAAKDKLTYQVKEFMRKRALSGLSNTSGDILFIDLLSDPDVDISLPNVAAKVKQSFRSYITTQTIRTKYDGIRTTEAESAYIELYEVKVGGKLLKNKLTYIELVNYFGMDNTVLNVPKTMTSKYNEELEITTVKLKASEVVDGKIVPSDLVGPNIHRGIFRMTKEDSLNDFYTVKGNSIFELEFDKNKIADIIISLHNDANIRHFRSPIYRFLIETEQDITKKNIITAVDNFEASLENFNVRIPTGKAGQMTPGKMIAFTNDLNNAMFFPSGNNIRSDANKDGAQLSTYVMHLDDRGNIITDDNTVEGLHNKIIKLIRDSLNDNVELFDQKSDVSMIVNYEGLETNNEEFVENGFSESVVNWGKAKAKVESVGIHVNLVSVSNSLLLSTDLLPETLASFKHGGIEVQGKILNYIGDWLQVILDNIKSNTLGNYGISQYAVNLLGPIIMQSQGTKDGVYKFDADVATENIISFFKSDVVKSVFRGVEYQKRLESFTSETPFEICTNMISNEKEIEKIKQLTALQTVIVNAEGFRRLSHFTAIRQGIKSADYDYDTYINNSSLYLGQPLSSFLNNEPLPTKEQHIEYMKQNNNSYKMSKKSCNMAALVDFESRIYDTMNTAKLLNGENFSSIKTELRVYTDKYLTGSPVKIMFEDTDGYKSIKNKIIETLSQGAFINKLQYYNLRDLVNNMIISEYLNNLTDDETKLTIIPFVLDSNGTPILPVNLKGCNIMELYTMDAKNMDSFISSFAESMDFILNTVINGISTKEEIQIYYQSILGKNRGLDYYTNNIAPLLYVFEETEAGRLFANNIKVVSDKGKKCLAIEYLETNQIPLIKNAFSKIGSNKIKDMFVFYTLIVSKFKSSKYSMSAIIPNEYYHGDDGITSAANRIFDKLNDDSLIAEHLEEIVAFYCTNPDNLRQITYEKQTFMDLKDVNHLPPVATENTKKNGYEIKTPYSTKNGNPLVPITSTGIYDFNKKVHTVEGASVIKFLSEFELQQLRNNEWVYHTFIYGHSYISGNVLVPGGEVITLTVMNNNVVKLTKSNDPIDKKVNQEKQCFYRDTILLS